jgi:class 3 adenylate cyclase
VERVERILLAFGLPHEGSGLDEGFVRALAAFQVGAALFGDDPTLGFTRVMSASMARVAEAAVGLFLAQVEPSLWEETTTELEVAEAQEAAVGAIDAIPPVLDHLLRAHMALAVMRSRVARAPDQIGEALTLGVGFVDLVGSTEWTERMSPREAASALSRFETDAWDLTTRDGGRVVKLIGDEAMFVSTSGLQACRIAVELCDRVGKDPVLPAARGAVGYGAVLARDGDYFGPLVNLVAHSVKAAAAGAVVVTDAVRRQIEAANDAGSPWTITELSPGSIRGAGDGAVLFEVR